MESWTGFKPLNGTRRGLGRTLEPPCGAIQDQALIVVCSYFFGSMYLTQIRASSGSVCLVEIQFLMATTRKVKSRVATWFSEFRSICVIYILPYFLDVMVECWRRNFHELLARCCLRRGAGCGTAVARTYCELSRKFPARPKSGARQVSLRVVLSDIRRHCLCHCPAIAGMLRRHDARYFAGFFAGHFAAIA